MKTVCHALAPLLPLYCTGLHNFEHGFCNYAHACALRVTVVVLCVCVSVSTATDPTERQSRHTGGLSIVFTSV